MYNQIVTSDFSEFGPNELKEVLALLTLYCKDEFEGENNLGDGLKVAWNKESGCVFLHDEEYITYMINEKGKLEEWLFCGYCGEEKFRSEFDQGSEKWTVKCQNCNHEF